MTGPTPIASSTTPAIETEGLGRRYRRRWALRDCTLSLPAGRIVGLVGVNGAGKTTLLHLVVGLGEPTEGTVRVHGEVPGPRGHHLDRIGFLAQNAPLYPSLTVGDHLTLGHRLNRRWDDEGTRDRIERLGLDLHQPVGQLSGGQRAQVALTVAIGKRPDVLVLDEPVASLDPLARREFLATLMEATAERAMTVVLSSHLLADLERVCDHLVVLARGRVRLAGDVDDLLGEHHLLSGPRRPSTRLPGGQEAITVTNTGRQTSVLVRTRQPILDPSWSVTDVGLEELVLAYMAEPSPQPVELAEAAP